MSISTFSQCTTVVVEKQKFLLPDELVGVEGNALGLTLALVLSEKCWFFFLFWRMSLRFCSFPHFFWDSSNELQKHIWPQTHDPPPISTRPDSPDLSSFVFGQKNGHRNGKKKKRLYSTSLALPLTPVQCRLFLVACCRHLRSTHCQSSRVPLPLY